ncbi:TPA: hypothetical protein EYP27_06890 [Candidatus Bathyarchaeota archaeon]|nr:hypothetical protein [Candidatus Bathyarchaeota archaeon]
MFSIEELKRIIDGSDDRFPKLEVHQIRYRIEQLKGAGLIETTKGPYQKVLLNDSEKETFLRLIELERTCKTVSNAIAELKSELIRQGKRYEAMSREDLIKEIHSLLEIIRRQNVEIEQLKAKVSKLMESRKPVEYLSFWQKLRRFFSRP